QTDLGGGVGNSHRARLRFAWSATTTIIAVTQAGTGLACNPQGKQCLSRVVAATADKRPAHSSTDGQHSRLPQLAFGNYRVRAAGPGSCDQPTHCYPAN